MPMVIAADSFIKDKQDAAPGIRKAVAYAKEHGITKIEFEAGTYRLESFERIQTPSIAHDDGCGMIDEKECHIYLDGCSDLTFIGKTLQDGSPATILEGVHQGSIQSLLPSIIWAENCRGLTLENLAFTRNPEMASAGRITDITEDVIHVEVFEGLPCKDGMAAYCMNRFDIRKQQLLGTSLTYGFGYDTRFQKTGERLLALRDPELVSSVHVGEGLSWHQSGKTDFQMFFGECHQLSLINIRVINTNGFAILTENCRDITARRLVLRPRPPQFFTGPRDGWKLYRCSGTILLEDCHIEGVRMDGQNVHSNYLVIEEIESANSLLCRCKYAPIKLTAPSVLEIGAGKEVAYRSLENWEIIGGTEELSQNTGETSACAAVAGTRNHISRYQLQVDSLPEGIQPEMLIHAHCWEPDSYTCHNSVFKNIAGAGQLLRCGHVEISGCTYENMMNAGVLIGAELDTHCEAGHGNHINIHDCSFIRCGTKPRYGIFGMGGVAVKSQGFHGPYNHHIEITDNHFEECQNAVELYDCRDVIVKHNTFTDCNIEVYRDFKTTESVEEYRRKQE